MIQITQDTPNSIEIRTRFYIISDTHGETLPTQHLPKIDAGIDVAIHCGDLTDGSRLQEFRNSLRMLKDINAPLKLVIAGNHDFTLDIPVFKKKVAEIQPPVEQELVDREYGYNGKVRELLTAAKADGVVFLDEGIHDFELANGARLTVYASPYTPSTNDWGFRYAPHEAHEWRLGSADVVITHGPPHGVLDKVDKRVGCPDLFRAVATSRPRLHAFGHIHSQWGAKLMTWRDNIETPTLFTAFDNDASTTVQTLAGLTPGEYDDEEEQASCLRCTAGRRNLLYLPLRRR
ncbi:Calcineurin-like phosphoesterase-like protein 7 [Elsinoe fawcettii]|nr:Calcineurin-like phosphoesterase-like protein 7 [Elsinoe fawcettii]